MFPSDQSSLLSRGTFILSGTAFLAACGGGVSPAPNSGSVVALTTADAVTSKLMDQHGLIAVTEAGRTIVSASSSTNRDLVNALSTLAPSASSKRSTQFQSVGCQGDPTCDSGGGGNSNADLPIIGYATSLPSGGQTQIGSVSTPYYNSFQSSITNTSPGPMYSPVYTLQKLGSCAAAATTSFATDMTQVAGAVLGGTVAQYITPGTAQASAIAGSSKAFLSGSISVVAFWDVLVTVTTSISLPALLGGVAVGTTIAIGMGTTKCMLTGSP